MLTTSIAILTLSLAGVSLGSVRAQPVPCGRLLTAVEVAAAAGPGFKNLGQESSAAGESECIWLLEDARNPRAIVLRFTQPGGGSAAVPGLFDSLVSKAEKLHGNTREVLDGMGPRAALVPGKKPGAMAVLILQTANGVAYVETDYLERLQILKLAKAIATP